MMTHFHVSKIFNHWCFQAEKRHFVQTCSKRCSSFNFEGNELLSQERLKGGKMLKKIFFNVFGNNKNSGNTYVYAFIHITERLYSIYTVISQYFIVLNSFLFSSGVVTAVLCNRKHPEIFTSVVRANSYQ